MACLSRPCHFRFFKGCLPQISVGPFFNILSHMNLKPPREFNTVFGSCVIFLVHGTILQQWASLLKNSASVAVEESHQPLLNNRSSDCWKILPVTVEQPCQTFLKLVKEHFPRNNTFHDCNWNRTHNHLVCKRTLNHLTKTLLRLVIATWEILVR